MMYAASAPRNAATTLGLLPMSAVTTRAPAEDAATAALLLGSLVTTVTFAKAAVRAGMAVAPTWPDAPMTTTFVADLAAGLAVVAGTGAVTGAGFAVEGAAVVPAPGALALAGEELPQPMAVWFSGLLEDDAAVGLPTELGQHPS